MTITEYELGKCSGRDLFKGTKRPLSLGYWENRPETSG